MEMTREERIDLNGWRKALNFKFEEFKSEERNLQNVHTPYSLCNEIISKLKENMGDFEGKTFCVFNIEFLEVLRHEFGVNLENVWFYTDCHKKALVCKHRKFKGVNVMEADFFDMLNKKDGKTFDVVIGNPPYQAPSKNNNKGAGNVLWGKFVEKSFNIAIKNGYVALIHPSGWRNIGGRYEKTKNILLKQQIQYLKINNVDEGLKVFKAGTRFDWYIAKKTSPSQLTIINDENSEINKANLKDMQFIPNGKMIEINKLFASEKQKKVNVLCDCKYHSVNGSVQKIKNSNFKYPCVQHVSAKTNEPSCFYYSDSKNQGHFGIPKVIFGMQISSDMEQYFIVHLPV